MAVGWGEKYKCKGEGIMWQRFCCRDYVDRLFGGDYVEGIVKYIV
jgi:hypothetical protein